MMPTVDQVNDILVSEMMKWVVVSPSDKGRAQLDALGDRLIRYFILFQPKRLDVAVPPDRGDSFSRFLVRSPDCHFA